MAASTTTNKEIKNAVDTLVHRFDLFEQKEEARHEKLEYDTRELKGEVFGNGKEGLKATVKTLKEDYDYRKKTSEVQDSANRSLRTGIYLLLLGQAATIVVGLLVR